MNTFNFYLDTKVTAWKRQEFDITANTFEEAKELAKQFYKDGEADSLPWEDVDFTTEMMSVSENGGQSTQELLTMNGDIIADNLND
jgi:hypothetical protein